MSAIKDKHNNKYTIALIICIIFFLDLLFLYYEKYNNQGLSLSSFRLLYIGNLLNLITTIAEILGTIVYTLRSKSKFNSSFLISFCFIITLLLIAASFSDKFNFPLPKIYIMDHPIRKIFIGALFTLFQFLQLLYIIIIWLYIFRRGDLLILRGLTNTVAVLIFFLMVTFVYVNLKKVNDIKSKSNPNKLNIAVVLGAAVWSNNKPSPSLAARVNEAEELYKKGIVNRIQLTGSNAPGELSESQVAYNYIKSSGINLSNVWMEKKTVSTAEQIRFIKDHLSNMINIGEIIIVSDDYHLTRVREICKFYDIRAGFAPSGLKLSFDKNIYYKLIESAALLVFWFFAI